MVGFYGEGFARSAILRDHINHEDVSRNAPVFQVSRRIWPKSAGTFWMDPTVFLFRKVNDPI